MRGGRFYSPSLKDVAWPERATLIFVMFHTFHCKFGRVEATAREKNYTQMYEKLEKINRASSIQPIFFKLGEYRGFNKNFK